MLSFLSEKERACYFTYLYSQCHVCVSVLCLCLVVSLPDLQRVMSYSLRFNNLWLYQRVCNAQYYSLESKNNIRIGFSLY